jgi:hypothetical protein
MAFIVKRDAIVIPAGIPVASTANVIVASTGENVGGLVGRIETWKFRFYCQ